MPSPSLEAIGLSHNYGQFAALTDLNLKLEGQKCVGFLGPNGAGKTTTMKIFTGLIRASKGKALVNGMDVHQNKMGALASCTSLIETPEIYPALTPKEALSMLCEIRGVPKEERSGRIEDALEQVKMQDWGEKKVGTFSKGMKQRVNVASTLLGDPDVIILDEPTTGLDPRGMSEVRDIVKSLGNRLVFMSSHLLAEVTEVCSEVALIDHGKLLVYDTISNVTSRFAGGGGAVEVGFANDLDDVARSKVSGLAGVQSVSNLGPRQLSVRYDAAATSLVDLFEQLAGLKIGAVSFKEGAEGLESAYLKLVKETL